jgi:insulysin
LTRCVLTILIKAGTQFCNRLYANLVTESLVEFSYDADLAGLKYSFNPYGSGIHADMDGYNDKMFLLVETVLEKIKTLVVDPRVVEVRKESV